LIKFGMENRY